MNTKVVGMLWIAAAIALITTGYVWSQHGYVYGMITYPTVGTLAFVIMLYFQRKEVAAEVAEQETEMETEFRNN